VALHNENIARRYFSIAPGASENSKYSCFHFSAFSRLAVLTISCDRFRRLDRQNAGSGPARSSAQRIATDAQSGPLFAMGAYFTVSLGAPSCSSLTSACMRSILTPNHRDQLTCAAAHVSRATTDLSRNTGTEPKIVSIHEL